MTSKTEESKRIVSTEQKTDLSDSVRSEAKKLLAHMATIVESTPKNEQGNAEIIAWVYDKSTPKGEWIYILLGSYTMTRATDVCIDLVRKFGTEFVTFSVVPKGIFHQINDDAESVEVGQDSSSVNQIAKTRAKTIDDEVKIKAETERHMNAETDTKSVEYFSNVVYRCTYLYSRLQQHSNEIKEMTLQYKKRIAELESLMKQTPTHRVNWENDAKTFGKKCGDEHGFGNMKRWFDKTFNITSQ